MGGLCVSFLVLLPYLHSLKYPIHSPVFDPSGECTGECCKLKPMRYHDAPPAGFVAVWGYGRGVGGEVGGGIRGQKFGQEIFDIG